MVSKIGNLIPRWRLLLGWPQHLASLVLLIALTIAIWRTFPLNTSAVILHYSVGVGIDFIGDGNQINILTYIGGIFFILNIILGHLVYNTSRPAAWVIWSINPISQAFLLIAYALLWQLNR